MLLLVLLSVGSVTAYIPIIVIIILIIAAQGVTGRDFLEVFGVNTLIGMAGGAKLGGAGKGLRGSKYRTSTKQTGAALTDTFGKRADNSIGTMIARKIRGKPVRVKQGLMPWMRNKEGVVVGGGIVGGIRNANRSDMQNMLAKMETSDLRGMLVHFGHGKRTEGMTGDQMRKYAVGNLRQYQITGFYAQNVAPKAPPGAPAPLAPPEKEGGTVRMAISPQGGLLERYKSYYGARTKKGRSYKRMAETLSSMPDDDIRSMLAVNGVDSTSMSRNDMLRTSMNRLNEKKVNSFLENKAKESKKATAAEAGEAAASAAVASAKGTSAAKAAAMSAAKIASKAARTARKAAAKAAPASAAAIKAAAKAAERAAKAARRAALKATPIGVAAAKATAKAAVKAAKAARKAAIAGTAAVGIGAAAKAQPPATAGTVLDNLNKKKWNLFTNPGFEWLQYDKGDSKLKEAGGYSKETYKIFVQPTADKFVDYVNKISNTLDGLIEKKEIVGAKFKFAKIGDTFNREELLPDNKEGGKLIHGNGVDAKRLDVSYEEKIVIYAKSAEEMEKIVKALNSTFKGEAYKYGTERNLDAYSLTNGAKWTYGINPLVHVRRGGAGNHEKLNRQRIDRGETVDKPPAGWDIPKDMIDRLRADSVSKAGPSIGTAAALSGKDKTPKRAYSIGAVAPAIATAAAEAAVEVGAGEQPARGRMYDSLMNYVEAKVKAGTIKRTTADELRKATDNYKKDGSVDRVFRSIGSVLSKTERTNADQLDSGAKELAAFFGDKEVSGSINDIAAIVRSHFKDDKVVTESVGSVMLNAKLDQGLESARQDLLKIYSGMKHAYESYDKHLEFLSSHGVDSPKVVLSVSPEIMSESGGVRYLVNGYYDDVAKRIALKYDAEDSTFVHEMAHAAQYKNGIGYFESADTPEKQEMSGVLTPLLHEGGSVFAQKLYEAKETWGDAFNYKFMVSASAEHAKGYLQNSERHSLTAWSGELYGLFKKSNDIHKDLYNMMKDEDKKDAKNKYGIGIAVANLLYAANNFDEKMTMRELNSGTLASQKVVEKLEKAIKADKDGRIIRSILEI